MTRYFSVAEVTQYIQSHCRTHRKELLEYKMETLFISTTIEIVFFDREAQDTYLVTVNPLNLK